MKKHNRALAIISSKSGASLLFVLAVMMLLMAVGVSVLVSAGSNLSTGINKQLDNRLNIYTDSMQRTILYGLKLGDDVDKFITTDTLTTLNGQILGALYKKATAPYAGPLNIPDGEYSTGLIIKYDDPSIKDIADLSAIESVEIKVDAVVRVTSYKLEQAALDSDGIEILDGSGKPDPTPLTDDDENPRLDINGDPILIISPYSPERPITAVLNGTATVTVTAKLDSGLTEKHVISAATYELLDSFLEQKSGTLGTGDMQIISSGTWNISSFERVDKVA